jgi:hypothetical protein
MKNALILARLEGMDVYNALNILDNEEAFAVISNQCHFLCFQGFNIPWREWQFAFLSL